MIHLSRVFMLLAIVVPSPYARPHKCEQRERSLADLDLAEEALRRAKQLYPNCEEEKEISNSSECSKRDKSLGFIDVALDLVSNAKKHIPFGSHVTTLEATTEELTTEVTGESFRPMDCQDLLAAGYDQSGVYNVWPRLLKSHVRVRCDMDTDEGGWTVIQRRGNFSQQENFDRDWQDYKNGFGNVERDFWLGNDYIFALTNQGNYSLRMDMVAVDGDKDYAFYEKFRIEDEKANYRLHLKHYSGGTGHRMEYHKLERFETRDRKGRKGHRSSRNCVEDRKGGWWYMYNQPESMYHIDDCGWCSPNGLYQPGVKNETSMFCHFFKGYIGLSSIDMKIKRREWSLD